MKKTYQSPNLKGMATYCATDIVSVKYAGNLTKVNGKRRQECIFGPFSVAKCFNFSVWCAVNIKCHGGPDHQAQASSCL
jgi:hypothetical protein